MWPWVAQRSGHSENWSAAGVSVQRALFEQPWAVAGSRAFAELVACDTLAKKNTPARRRIGDAPLGAPPTSPSTELYSDTHRSHINTLDGRHRRRRPPQPVEQLPRPLFPVAGGLDARRGGGEPLGLLRAPEQLQRLAQPPPGQSISG